MLSENDRTWLEILLARSEYSAASEMVRHLIRKAWVKSQKEAIMPLKKSASKSARNQNIKTEIAAGKPVKQAVAIGYSVQRRAKRGKR